MFRSPNGWVKSLKEQVYDYLFDQLGQETADTRSYLDLTKIAEKLGISKTPLRDALIFLEAEGFVEIVPRRGVRVKQLSLDEIKDIYQVIGSLESDALLESVKHFNETDYQVLDRLTRGYREQFENGSYDKCLDVNFQFHSYFIDRCGNSLLARLIQAQKRRLYDWPRRTRLLLDWERKNLAEHEWILRLLEAGDAQGAADVLRTVHWGFTSNENYIKQFYGPR